MSVPYQLLLTAEQTQELQAARTASLKPHTVDTVCAWVHRYQAAELAGLRVRRRKPASFPGGAQRGAGDAATPGRPTP